MKTPTPRSARTAQPVPPAAEVATDAGAVRCPATAELAGFIADDAMCVIQLLTDLVGEAVEYTSELACARVVLARMGMVAHHIRDAHRTDGRSGGWHRESVHWLLLTGGTDDNAEAWATLARRAAP